MTLNAPGAGSGRVAPARELPSSEPTIVSALLRYRLLAALIISVLVAAALAFSLSRPKVYRSAATLLIEHPRSQTLLERGVQLSNQQRYVADQAVFVKSNKVAERAAEIAPTLPGGAVLTLEDIYGGLDVAHNNENNDVLEISFEADDPNAAAAGANAVVRAYADVQLSEAKARTAATKAELEAQIKEIGDERDSVRQQLDAARASGLAHDELIQEMSALTQRRSELAGRLDQLETETLRESAGVSFSSPALPPSGPVSRQVVRYVVLAVLLGIVVSALLAYFLALRRRRFARRQEPEEILAAPLLSDVPDFTSEGIQSSLPVSTHVTSASAEAFRFVASTLSVQRDGSGALSFVVTSALAAEGKSTVAANTALALVYSGARVVAVDADIVRAELTSRLLGRRHNGPDVTEVMQGRARLEAVTQEVKVADGLSLRLVPASEHTAPAQEFFGAVDSRSFFEQVKEGVDFVVIDGLPLLQSADAANLLGHADKALLVVPHKGMVANQEEVVDRLGLVGTPLLGYVYNRAPLRSELASYYAASNGRRPPTHRRSRPGPRRAQKSAERGSQPVTILKPGQAGAQTSAEDEGPPDPGSRARRLVRAILPHPQQG